jgi:hypothetical protein
MAWLQAYLPFLTAVIVPFITMKGVSSVVDERLFEFPICYTSQINPVGIGWGVHQTVADECKAAGIKKALIVTTGLKGTGIIDEIKSILT